MICLSNLEWGGHEINCSNVSAHANKSETVNRETKQPTFVLVYILDILMHTIQKMLQSGKIFMESTLANISG